MTVRNKALVSSVTYHISPGGGKGIRVPGGWMKSVPTSECDARFVRGSEEGCPGIESDLSSAENTVGEHDNYWKLQCPGAPTL